MFSSPDNNRTLATALFSFLNMNDMGALDVALTNHFMRPSLFEVYPLLCVQHLKKGLDRRQMLWVIGRSIGVESITFPCDATVDDIIHILTLIKGSPYLRIKHVDMSYCGSVTNGTLFSQLFHACTQMETLNLAGCNNISRDTIQQMGSLCPYLTSLDLSDCDLVKTVTALSKGFRSLTHLVLARRRTRHSDGIVSGGKGYKSMLKEGAIKALACGCPNLVALDLSNCDNTRDGAVISLVKAFPALTSLNLNGCDKITDSAIRTLSQNCPGLINVELNIGHGYSGKITDSSVIALSRNCPGLTSFGASRCYNITDAAATVLSKGCPGLTSVDFTCCNRITNEGILALTECTSLTSLHVSKCVKITGAAVTALSQRCTHLTTLSLHSCAKITDTSLIALSESCKSLTSLDITNCNKLTDEAIKAVATNCCALSSLYMAGCENVTDDGLVALFKGCRSLQCLISPSDEGLAGERLRLEIKGKLMSDERFSYSSIT